MQPEDGEQTRRKKIARKQRARIRSVLELDQYFRKPGKPVAVASKIWEEYHTYLDDEAGPDGDVAIPLKVWLQEFGGRADYGKDYRSHIEFENYTDPDLEFGPFVQDSLGGLQDDEFNALKTYYEYPKLKQSEGNWKHVLDKWYFIRELFTDEFRSMEMTGPRLGGRAKRRYY